MELNFGNLFWSPKAALKVTRGAGDRNTFLRNMLYGTSGRNHHGPKKREVERDPVNLSEPLYVPKSFLEDIRMFRSVTREVVRHNPCHWDANTRDLGPHSTWPNYVDGVSLDHLGAMVQVEMRKNGVSRGIPNSSVREDFSPVQNSFEQTRREIDVWEDPREHPFPTYNYGFQMQNNMGTDANLQLNGSSVDTGRFQLCDDEPFTETTPCPVLVNRHPMEIRDLRQRSLLRSLLPEGPKGHFFLRVPPIKKFTPRNVYHGRGLQKPE
jgi:hypothetical protein